jgi:hypothetical protein
VSGKNEKHKRKAQRALTEAMKKHLADGVSPKAAALLALQEVTQRPAEECAAFILELTRRRPTNWTTGVPL